MSNPLYIDIEIHEFIPIWEGSRSYELRRNIRTDRLLWMRRPDNRGGVFSTVDKKIWIDDSVIFDIIDKASPWYNYLIRTYIRFVGVK